MSHHTTPPQPSGFNAKTTNFKLKLAASAVIAVLSAGAGATPSSHSPLPLETHVLGSSDDVAVFSEDPGVVTEQIDDQQTKAFQNANISADNTDSTIGVDTIGLLMDGRATATFTVSPPKLFHKQNQWLTKGVQGNQFFS